MTLLTSTYWIEIAVLHLLAAVIEKKTKQNKKTLVQSTLVTGTVCIKPVLRHFIPTVTLGQGFSFEGTDL